jgi:hypothetical protein
VILHKTTLKTKQKSNRVLLVALTRGDAQLQVAGAGFGGGVSKALEQVVDGSGVGRALEQVVGRGERRSRASKVVSIIGEEAVTIVGEEMVIYGR